MERYRNKYRISTVRLPKWDYKNNAAYYVTICTASRRHYFGEIVDKKMYLSKMGIVVRNEWLRTPEIRPDMNLTLDEFVVMPDHFHGIIIIGKNKYNSNTNDHDRGAMHHASIMIHSKTKTINRFAPQSKNLASVIRGFKSSVTTFARKHHIEFEWQGRYYEHIIRDDQDFYRIRKYIKDNPLNWKDNDPW